MDAACDYVSSGHMSLTPHVDKLASTQIMRVLPFLQLHTP